MAKNTGSNYANMFLAWLLRDRDVVGQLNKKLLEDAINLLAATGMDINIFLEEALTYAAFWHRLAEVIQNGSFVIKYRHFWICDCKQRFVHSYIQRDNCPKCRARMNDARRGVYIDLMKESNFFTAHDLHDYLCFHNIHEYDDEMNRSCGAYLCVWCGAHKNLVRCYCGWSATGRDGYTELIEMGERIEPDE